MIAVIFEQCAKSLAKPRIPKKIIWSMPQAGVILKRRAHLFECRMDGFISVERFQSLTDPDKLLSLSF